jgi:hypothetical protein
MVIGSGRRRATHRVEFAQPRTPSVLGLLPLAHIVFLAAQQGTGVDAEVAGCHRLRRPVL